MIQNVRKYFKKYGGGYFLSGSDIYSYAAEYVKSALQIETLAAKFFSTGQWILSLSLNTNNENLFGTKRQEKPISHVSKSHCSFTKE